MIYTLIYLDLEKYTCLILINKEVGSVSLRYWEKIEEKLCDTASHSVSKSVAMTRHSMGVVKKAVEVLNPGQTPVIACDQPLFMIAKQIQWMWTEQYGEDSFVVMLGGLHIKMTFSSW